MLVDSFSFTFDETAPSVDAQAQLLLEAGLRNPRRRFWEPETDSPTGSVPAARAGAQARPPRPSRPEADAASA